MPRFYRAALSCREQKSTQAAGIPALHRKSIRPLPADGAARRRRPFTGERTTATQDTGLTDMIKIGYKLMAEEHGPAALVRNTVRAEQAGFEFAAISDHFFPWLDEQGHAPF